VQNTVVFALLQPKKPKKHKTKKHKTNFKRRCYSVVYKIFSVNTKKNPQKNLQVSKIAVPLQRYNNRAIVIYSKYIISQYIREGVVRSVMAHKQMRKPLL
jgi:hypothetical protein